MSGLFGDLPPPSGTKATIDSTYSITVDNVIERDAKRPRKLVESDDRQKKTTAVVPAPQTSQVSQPVSTPQQRQHDIEEDGQDHLSSALQRITNHISNPKKCIKASELLRTLLLSSKSPTPEGEGDDGDDGNTQLPLSPSIHGPLIYSALVASITDDPLARTSDPLYARECFKLFSAASEHSDGLFTAEQRGILESYALYAIVRYQLMTTDDSFTLNKIVKNLKTMIDGLAEAGDYRIEQQQVVDEADMIKRAGIVACIESGRECYKKQWARTCIDMLVEYAVKFKHRFLPGQHPAIDAMAVFVKEQKIARRQSKSNTHNSDDSATRLTSSFEQASVEWGKASVPRRGKVGSGGDRKSHSWLG